MPPSYRLIDYSLRPAKSAERRMFVEAIRRLVKFGSIENYQYVGFGAIWFTDFSLFHRTLGINRMVSIEREINHRPRFEFNKPFGGVELMFGSSAQELPKIDWRNRTIAWLDYDDQLNLSILADLRTVVDSVSSGSMLFVSLQAQNAPLKPHPDDAEESVELETTDDFRMVFSAARTPSEMNDADLIGWRLARLYRRVVLAEIQDALEAVNAGKAPGQRMLFKQVVAIEYADGAKMTTVGGVFVDEGQEAIFNSCEFDRLPFYQPEVEALRLDMPKLTPKEMREIERHLPCATPEDLEVEGFPTSDVRAFARLYRYLPTFATFEP